VVMIKVKRSASVRVAVVDDDEDARLCFRDILQLSDDFVLSAAFPNANEALRGIPLLHPDLVLMDIYLPDLNGIECTRRLKHLMPSLRVIIITGIHNKDSVPRSLDAGAEAFLFKPITADQCLATLTFAAWHTMANTETARKSGQGTVQTKEPRNCMALSPREKEVLKYLAEGLLYKEISDRLGVSYSAVHKYQHHLFVKLHVSNRSEAIRVWQYPGPQ